MSNKRRAKEDQEWTKEDESIARYVRFNCPTEMTLFQGNEVHYFTGSKAVDTLYESSYGTKAKGDAKFGSRRAAEDFMQYMLERNMIWRAKKLVPKKKEDKDAKGEDAGKSPKSAEPKKKKDRKKEEEEVETENEDKKKEEEKTEGKKKKVKLLAHNIQVFSDANDTYVWVFDPTPLYKKVIGFLMVIGTIVGCLFPLWPMWLRQGIYYLSMAGIGFFGVIIAIAILRTILFALIWLVSWGEHKLWILPNLTEDVGFFESFKPLYTYERASQSKDNDKKKKDMKKKKEKDSDIEEDKVVKEKKESEESKTNSQEDESESGSVSDEESQLSDEAEENGSSPSPKGEVRKRRPRKDDGDFVIVPK